MPVQSPRAHASISPSSVASSTTLVDAHSARMARSMEMGAPIWIADAKVAEAVLETARLCRSSVHRARTRISSSSARSSRPRMLAGHTYRSALRDHTRFPSPGPFHIHRFGSAVFILNPSILPCAHHTHQRTEIRNPAGTSHAGVRHSAHKPAQIRYSARTRIITNIRRALSCDSPNPLLCSPQVIRNAAGSNGTPRCWRRGLRPRRIYPARM
jgi:hypothetical protein